MEKTELKIGDVVQISPDHEAFGGCLLVVTEPKEWGAQGFIMSAYNFEATKWKGRAFLRVKFEDVEYVGSLAWMQEQDIDREEGEEQEFYDDEIQMKEILGD